MVKLLYKPLGTLVSVLGGLAASFLFRRMWRVIGGESEPPTATQPRRGWGEVLLAAALQGAVYGFVKAVVDRAEAVGFARATGAWPGND
jgi:Protein of unknown function (DUF4235)